MKELMTIGLYLILVGIVIYSANKASNYVDDIDQKTNIGGALLGGIVLAGITSLPELITTITSSALVGKPGLAFGNIFGSNLFNLVIVAAADLYFYKKYFLNKINIKENLKTSVIVSILYVVILIPLALDVLVFKDIELFAITTGQLSLISLVVLLIYALNIKRLISEASGDSDDSQSTDEKPVRKEKQSIKTELIMLAVWSVALVLSSILITYVTGEIAEILNLNESFAGALFLGIATSLPELTAVYTLVKKDNYDAAVSNAIGSNIFNLVILSFVDLIIFENVYSSLLSNPSIQMNVATLLVLGLINTLLFIFILKRKRTNKTFVYVLPSLLIVLNYVGYLLVSAGTFDFLFR